MLCDVAGFEGYLIHFAETHGKESVTAMPITELMVQV